MGALSKALEGIQLPEETKSLVAKADSLLDGEFQQAQYIDYLQSEIKRLREEKGISGVRDGLTFNDHTGLHADQAGRLYCSICLGQDKRNPMKTELPHGWRCSADPKHWFSNPDSKPPVVNMRGPRGGGGPQGWMR